MSTEHTPHSELPPVSYEALAENNRHTHANLDACIEARQRLEEQLQSANERKQELWTRLLDMEDKYLEAHEQHEGMKEAT